MYTDSSRTQIFFPLYSLHFLKQHVPYQYMLVHTHTLLRQPPDFEADGADDISVDEVESSPVKCREKGFDQGDLFDEVDKQIVPFDKFNCILV